MNKSMLLGMLIGAGTVVLGLIIGHEIKDYMDYLAVQQAVNALIDL